MVEQIAVGAVNFDAVKSGALDVLGATAEFSDDAGNFIEVEGPGHNVIAHRTHQAYVTFRSQGTRRNRQSAAEIIRVPNASYVPKKAARE